MGKELKKTKSDIINSILNTDEGNFAYLFPYRDSLPKIDKHIFTDLKESTSKFDEYIVDKMLDTDYIGWTCKTVLNLDLFPIQISILRILWKTPFPLLVASRGGSKSFMLAVFAVLKALLDPGSKIVIVGAGLRQSKLVFNYIDNIWNSSSILRSIVGSGKNVGPRQGLDSCYFKIGKSTITSLPLGDGSRIRGLRATCVIADEFASVPREIFDVVVRGFAATSKSPVEEAKQIAIEKRLTSLGIPESYVKNIENKMLKGNQIIYSGTAYYQFNHFAEKFETWKKIIESRGNRDKVAEIFGGEGNIPDNFDYRDYAIIRIPSDYLPDGLLDKRQLANARATLPSNIYLMEYQAIFVKDSNGFFARSMIESCTVKPFSPIATRDGDVTFNCMMKGVKDRKYVIAIDPGAERDNIGIVILEIWPNHYRVVYCWSCNKTIFNKKKKDNLIKSSDYYAYCCSHIRKLARLFSPIRIEMDSQGCGYPLAEMLRDKKTIDKEAGDFPIYEILKEDVINTTDSETDGPHIINLVKPTNEFNASCNISLHKSLETKRLLFPAFDTVVMQSALIAEKANDIFIDTYEECVNNIEELKNELCTIQQMETATGKDKFDIPSMAKATGATEGKTTKGRLRKDRYTSLLYAHKYIYDNDNSISTLIDYTDVPGHFGKVNNKKDTGLYTGPGLAHMTNNDDWISGKSAIIAIKNGEVM